MSHNRAAVQVLQRLLRAAQVLQRRLDPERIAILDKDRSSRSDVASWFAFRDAVTQLSETEPARPLLVKLSDEGLRTAMATAAQRLAH